MERKPTRREFLHLSGVAVGGLLLAGYAEPARGAQSRARRCCVETDAGVRPVAGTPKPGYLADYTDPRFGSKVTRVAGNPGTGILGVPGTRWPSVARHGYSKIQAWNATQSLLVLSEVQLSSGTVLLFLDGSTYRPVFARRPGYTEVRWSHTQPDVMHWVRGDAIGTWDVRADESTTTGRFRGYRNLYFGPWEGNFSNDGRWVALKATRRSDNRRVGFAYDTATRRKYPDINLGGWRFLDWVSISPLGNYVVVHGEFDDVGADQTRIFTRKGAPVGFWQRNSGNSFHYDMTVDPADSREVVVGVSNSRAEGEVIKRRLEDGALTRLTFAGSYASHVSTRNLGRPGWAYVTYEGSPGPYRSEAVAVKLDGTAVERYAQTRNRRNPDYWGEAHGSPSPDGQRVIWASSWGRKRPVQAYVGDVRVGTRDAGPSAPPRSGTAGRSSTT